MADPRGVYNDFDTGQSVSNNTTYVYNRGVRAAFSYRFGKLENKPSRPKRSIRNDEKGTWKLLC